MTKYYSTRSILLLNRVTKKLILKKKLMKLLENQCPNFIWIIILLRRYFSLSINKTAHFVYYFILLLTLSTAPKTVKFCSWIGMRMLFMCNVQLCKSKSRNSLFQQSPLWKHCSNLFEILQQTLDLFWKKN